MRLLFIYTEFLNWDGTKKYHRGFSQLSLNFSTGQRFSYENGILAVTPLSHPIPPDFFGDRIYNVTTIVGDNGAGKTTILHYLIDLLRQFYEGRYHGSDRGLLVVEDRDRTYVLKYHGKYELCLKDFPDRFEIIPLHKAHALLLATKLIYLANTLTYSDLALVRQQPVKADDQYVNLFHFRQEFLYNCSTASLMVENCQNDSGRPIHSAAEYLHCFFSYEQYKQVKYVFDRRQYAILEELRSEGYPVPVPKKLTVELQIADYSTLFNDLNHFPTYKEVYPETLDEQYNRLVFELYNSCVETFLKTAILHSNGDCCEQYKQYIYQETERRLFHFNGNEADVYKFYMALKKIYSIYYAYEANRQGKNSRSLINHIKNNCINFLEFVYAERNHLRQYFEIESLQTQTVGDDKKTITFSIKTTGEAAEWFIIFLQKYRYICEPYYFLKFHWGLSSGEQNLLRLFSSLYYIFDSDYTNPRRGDYKIYNKSQNRKISCDSVLLWLDEADLTYHPEWQRCFLSILTAFLPKVYPDTCCREIQIFLTTHSPLMLGDSPAQSVIYLYKDAEGCIKVDGSGSRQTFGENLYMLLRNSFHVQDGAIGELVHIKIREILNTLKKLDCNLLACPGPNEVPFEEVRRYQDQLHGYKEGVVAFLADGIIKAKLETEIGRRLQQLEVYAPVSRSEQESPFAQWNDTQLENHLKALTEELERRKEEFQ